VRTSNERIVCIISLLVVSPPGDNFALASAQDFALLQDWFASPTIMSVGWLFNRLKPLAPIDIRPNNVNNRSRYANPTLSIETATVVLVSLPQ
jgi:hypothetical protein